MTDHATPERAALGYRTAPEQPRTTSDAAAAFADLICADTGLLHLEFDAIIAANFPVGGGQRSRPPPRQSRPAAPARPQRPAPRQPAPTASGLAPSEPRAGGQMRLSRQRSPP